MARKWPAWAAPLALAILVALPGNGADRPLETHEIYVARTAEEMLRSGDWFRPTFNGELRLEKPPLSYWLTIAAHLALGRHPHTRVTPFEARLPSVVAAAGLVFAVYWLGCSIAGDRRVGVLAGALTATSVGFVSYAHNARPEMAYALGCAVEMLGLVRAQSRLEQGRSPIPPALLAWTGYAFALLAKGPLLPTFLLLGWGIGWWFERPRQPLVRVLRPGIGLLVVAPVVLVAFGGIVRAEPGAPSYWWDQMFHHGGSRSLGWYLPLEGYYAYASLPLFLPWLVLLPLAVRASWRNAIPGTRPLGIAVITCALLLSFSPTRHAYYLLPAVPLVLVSMASAAVDWFDARHSHPGALRRFRRALQAHFGLLAAGCLIAVWIGRRPETRGSALALGFGVIAACSTGGAVALGRPRAARALVRSGAVLVLLIGGAMSLGCWGRIGWSEDRYEEARFARQVANAVPRADPIVSVGPAVESLVYLGDRRVRRIRKADLAAAVTEDARTHVLVHLRDLPLAVPLEGPILVSGPGEDALALMRAERRAQ